MKNQKMDADFDNGKWDRLGTHMRIQKMIKGQPCDFETSKLSKREWNELMESFGFKEKIL